MPLTLNTYIIYHESYLFPQVSEDIKQYGWCFWLSNWIYYTTIQSQPHITHNHSEKNVYIFISKDKQILRNFYKTNTTSMKRTSNSHTHLHKQNETERKKYLKQTFTHIRSYAYYYIYNFYLIYIYNVHMSMLKSLIAKNKTHILNTTK